MQLVYWWDFHNWFLLNLVCYSAFSSLFLKAYITLLNLVHLLLFAARSICFYVFGLYLVSLLCYQYPFHIIILSCVFLFFIFDECLIFSLIDSIIFPITSTWFELMEVCATTFSLHLFHMVRIDGGIFLSLFFVWLLIKFENFD